MTFELKPEDTQVIDEAIQAGLIDRPDEVVDVGVETLRTRLLSRVAAGASSRQDAIRRMQEFADEYHLSLGERITRDLLHDGHRY
ncbi:MAG TPA: hypothetical protein VH302_00020 [Bryobacteraceae bacterium]|jgi:hypothetical protein|nr:hypothetical protein [Bryobacteraceae bacterium]